MAFAALQRAACAAGPDAVASKAWVRAYALSRVCRCRFRFDFVFDAVCRQQGSCDSNFDRRHVSFETEGWVNDRLTFLHAEVGSSPKRM